MRLAGFSVCPADAHEAVKTHCGLVLSKKGGHGAVRELCELIGLYIAEKRDSDEPK